MTISFQSSFLIVNANGLHARPASKLVQLASRFMCNVQFEVGDQTVNAKSIMGVLLLCASKGTHISIVAQGEDAKECVETLGALIQSGFGETP